MDETEAPKKKKRENLKFVAYFLVVLIATGISLVVSLWGNFSSVWNAFASAKPLYLLVIFLVVVLSYAIEGLIIKIFCRLYTRHYKWGQGFAATMVCTFYNDVTPGASGGQVMEAYTLKQQGIQVSNAASIMVMWFILYQSALVVFDVFALGFEFNSIMSIKSIDIPNTNWSIPMVPLIIIGFGLNLFVIVMLYAMSFSHKFHNFILHYVIGFLGKIHLVKNPDKMRENLRVQVENFKIELKRLQSNIPVTLLIILLFFLVLILRNSIPYFAGMALSGADENIVFSVNDFFEASFLSSFHQMITGLIPIPGSAGVSELFFYYLFANFFQGMSSTINVAAVQILWRTATFHIVLLFSGIFASLYRSRPKAAPHMANRQTFVNLQLETFDERKRSADTMFETSKLSRIEIQRRLYKSLDKPKKEKKSKAKDQQRELNASNSDIVKQSKKAKKENDDEEWEDINIDA